MLKECPNRKALIHKLFDQRIHLNLRHAAGVDEHVRFEADDLGNQFQPEPVHDRHGQDQRPHPERDPDDRNDGDEGETAMLALCAKVAHREHALERADGSMNDPLLLRRVHMVRSRWTRGSA